MGNWESMSGQLSLFEALVSIPQREVAGSDTQGRYAYQKHFGLLKAINLLRANEKFFVVFEFHDDLIIIKADDNLVPLKAKFYQVKTKKPKELHLLGNFLASGQGQPVLLNMYSNIRKLSPENIESSILASNREFKFCVSGQNASDLKDEEREQILKEIKEAHADANEKELEWLHFEVCSELSIEHHRQQIYGFITDLFNHLYGEGPCNVDTLYKVLSQEIDKRTQHKGNTIKTVADLVEHKALSSEQLQKYFNQANYITRRAIKFESVRNDLPNTLAFDEKQKLHTAWNTLSAEITDPANTSLHKLIAEIKDTVSKSEIKVLWDFVENYYTKHRVRLTKIYPQFAEAYLKTVIMWCCYEKE